RVRQRRPYPFCNGCPSCGRGLIGDDEHDGPGILGTSRLRKRNHASLRAAAVGDENWVPCRWGGCGPARAGVLRGSGGGGDRGRCTVVMACRLSSLSTLGPFEAV